MSQKARPNLEEELKGVDPAIRVPVVELFHHIDGFRDVLSDLNTSLARLIAVDPACLDRVDRYREALLPLGILERDLVDVAGRALAILIRIQGVDDEGVIAAHREILRHLAGALEAAGKIVRQLVGGQEDRSAEKKSLQIDTGTSH